MIGYKLVPADPYNSEFLQLVAELDAYQQVLYPAQSNHFDSADALAAQRAHVLLAVSEGTAIGCGCVKPLSDYGEIKRLYTSPTCRGHGVGHAIMDALHQWLSGENISHAKLETGIHQRAAIELYRSLGYTECEPFGNYKADPLSVFMHCEL